eukprot:NODE_6_length_70510_cov_1.054395.p50 type:complete len:161 gc:universal NODE_6_length_70510_cov_1.054395:27195-27677(+)
MTITLPKSVEYLITPTLDSNLVSLVATEKLLKVLDAKLVEELYDSRLIPIAASEPTYALYLSNKKPNVAILIRRSQIRFGFRKEYFEELKQCTAKCIGIGSLPTYLKSENLLSKGSNFGTSNRFGIETVVYYSEHGNLDENASALEHQSVKYLRENNILI